MENIHVGKIDNVEILGSVNATAVTGIGLWTSICYAVANIFGSTSKNYKAKLNKITTQVNESLLSEANNLGGTGVMNVSYNLYGLTIIASGIAYKGVSICDKRENETQINKETNEKETIEDKPNDLAKEEKDNNIAPEVKEETPVEQEKIETNTPSPKQKDPSIKVLVMDVVVNTVNGFKTIRKGTEVKITDISENNIYTAEVVLNNETISFQRINEYFTD